MSDNPGHMSRPGVWRAVILPLAGGVGVAIAAVLVFLWLIRLLVGLIF